jgi:hypothetical protein
MSTATSPYRFAWRADFSNQSLNLLHAEAFHHAVLDYDEEGLRRLYFDACGFRPTIAGLIDAGRWC